MLCLTPTGTRAAHSKRTADAVAVRQSNLYRFETGHRATARPLPAVFPPPPPHALDDSRFINGWD